MAALEEEGLALTDPVSGEDSQVRGRSCGWPQCVLGSGDEPLPERRVEVFRVWVTWPFC